MSIVTIFLNTSSDSESAYYTGWGAITKKDGREHEASSGWVPGDSSYEAYLLGCLSAVKNAVELLGDQGRLIIAGAQSPVLNDLAGSFQRWQNNDWRMKNGGEVAHRRLWEQLAAVLADKTWDVRPISDDAVKQAGDLAKEAAQTAAKNQYAYLTMK